MIFNFDIKKLWVKLFSWKRINSDSQKSIAKSSGGGNAVSAQGNGNVNIQGNRNTINFRTSHQAPNAIDYDQFLQRLLACFSNSQAEYFYNQITDKLAQASLKNNVKGIKDIIEKTFKKPLVTIDDKKASRFVNCQKRAQAAIDSLVENRNEEAFKIEWRSIDAELKDLFFTRE